MKFFAAIFYKIEGRHSYLLYSLQCASLVVFTCTDEIIESEHAISQKKCSPKKKIDHCFLIYVDCVV